MAFLQVAPLLILDSDSKDKTPKVWMTHLSDPGVERRACSRGNDRGGGSRTSLVSEAFCAQEEDDEEELLYR